MNQLDYEGRSKYELVVRATDSVSGVHSEVPVSISVEDSNDNPPEFTHNEYNVTLSEATPFGTTVLAVNALDQDSGNKRFLRLIRIGLTRPNDSPFLGVNAQVSYRLLPDALGGSEAGSDFFQVNSKDGTVVLARSLDRETQSHHHLLVVASDAGNPSLSSTAHIWVKGKLQDMNGLFSSGFTNAPAVYYSGRCQR